MGVEIQSAQIEDRDAVIALWQACDLTRPWNPPVADFDQALSSPTSDVLVYNLSGELVGTIIVGFDGHRGWVYYLAVSPHNRKVGIGRALMDAAEVWLTEKGCRKIQLMFRTENTSVGSFYSSLGYEEQKVTTLGKWIG